MKNLLKLLIIISVFAFAGIQSADAQINVRVWWAGQCPDTCTSQDTCSYFVEYALVDYCVNPPVVRCPGSKTVSCSALEAIFPCDFDCLEVNNNPCYLLTARATKYCNGPGGNIAICIGTGAEWKTCKQLHTDPSVQIIW
jgi:hypothetical protein